MDTEFPLYPGLGTEIGLWDPEHQPYSIRSLPATLISHPPLPCVSRAKGTTR